MNTENTNNIIINSAFREVIQIRQQRFCLKCGKLLPNKLSINYSHHCEKPDFIKNAL